MSTSVRPTTFVAALGALAALVLASETARADSSTIKRPGAHPDYVFEAEPHFLFGFVDPPGGKAGKGFGPGFRGTIELVDNGFVKTINNTVGLGFGIDWLAFPEKNKKTSLFVPIVMQWNFWISRNWSVFGEPGGGFYLGNATGVRPVFYGGARFHITDRFTLTLRAGYPTFSAGVSFLF
jgi:hypothetical protein